MKQICVLFVCAGLGACVAGEDYAAPRLNLPHRWHAQDDGLTTGSLPQTGTAWWRDFNDPAMTNVIEAARTNNFDVKLAEARLAEARAAQTIVRASFFPQIGGSAGTARGLSSSTGAAIDTTQTIGLQGSWDIDLFGGTQRRAQAAEAGLEAADADYGRAKLLLVAETARTYILLRSVEAQMNLTQRNLDLQRGSLRITRGQRREGAISDLELARADAQTGATEARLPSFRSARSAALNRLSVLMGEAPGAVEARLSATHGVIPQMGQKPSLAGPVGVLASRPDIRAAERRLAQAAALKGAATTDLFPKISLDGFFSATGSQIAGAASPWSLAAGAVLPLLNFGRLEAQIDAADARQVQALQTYKSTVLQALAETENILSAARNDIDRKARLAHVAGQQARAARIAREQYKGGIATQLDVLSAAQNQLDAETALALSEADVAVNVVLLHTALGDGAMVK